LYYEAVLAVIARFDENLANKLGSGFLAQCHSSSSPECEATKFLAKWCTVLFQFPNCARLRDLVRADVAKNMDFARAFYGQAPLIARSMLTFARSVVPLLLNLARSNVRLAMLFAMLNLFMFYMTLELATEIDHPLRLTASVKM